MTEQTDDYNEDESNEEPQQRNWRRQLEADAKAGKEAVAALAEAQAATLAAQRELVMRRAGVDVESPLGQMFVKAYDGSNDVDSVISQWSAITGKPAPDTSGISPEQQATIARISGSITDGVPSGANAPDFEAELDSIPVLVDGNWNPNYVNQILAKTAEQAAREGRPFAVDSSGVAKWDKGNMNSPITQPLR
jgi:hypothetical protein